MGKRGTWVFTGSAGSGAAKKKPAVKKSGRRGDWVIPGGPKPKSRGWGRGMIMQGVLEIDEEINDLEKRKAAAAAAAVGGGSGGAAGQGVVNAGGSSSSSSSKTKIPAMKGTTFTSRKKGKGKGKKSVPEKAIEALAPPVDMSKLTARGRRLAEERLKREAEEIAQKEKEDEDSDRLEEAKAKNADVEDGRCGELNKTVEERLRELAEKKRNSNMKRAATIAKKRAEKEEQDKKEREKLASAGNKNVV